MNKKRITIIRHGKPDAHHKYVNRKSLKGSEIIQFIHDWDSCELSKENKIPGTLKETVAHADYCISSTLKRAIDSLKLLGIEKSDASELFNEAELPHGFLLKVKMPALVWFIMIRFLWVLGLRMNSESYKEFRGRIRKAYEFLSSRSEKSDHIAVLGHGFANRQLKKELKRNGWNHVENHGGHDYWSFDTFEKR